MLKRLAGATGLEPATFGVTGRRSNQLSYTPALPRSISRQPVGLDTIRPRRSQAHSTTM